MRCASASRNKPQGEDAGEPKHHWRGSRRSWMKLSRNSPGSRRLRGRRGLTGSDSTARRTAPILRRALHCGTLHHRSTLGVRQLRTVPRVLFSSLVHVCILGSAYM